MFSIAENQDIVTTEAHALERNKKRQVKMAASMAGSDGGKTKTSGRAATSFFGFWSSKPSGNSEGSRADSVQDSGGAAAPTTAKDPEPINPLAGTWSI